MKNKITEGKCKYCDIFISYIQEMHDFWVFFNRCYYVLVPIFTISAWCKVAICNKWPNVNHCILHYSTMALLRAHEDSRKIGQVYQLHPSSMEGQSEAPGQSDHYYTLLTSLLRQSYLIITQLFHHYHQLLWQ